MALNDIRGWFIDHGLVRARRGKMVAGVCAGVARRYNLPVWLVRVGYLASWMIPGPHILLYLVLAILMPVEGEQRAETV